MIMFKKIHLLSLPALLLLTACSNNNPTQETAIGEIPSWILNPQTEDGIAVSECVLWSGNMSIDKQQAMANARASLAQRIDTRVSAMDKAYSDKVDVATGIESGVTFSSVSKQVTEQNLSGTSALKTDIVKIAEKDNLCVLVAIGQASTKTIFEELVSASKLPLNAEQKDALYQEFKAQDAEQQLDQEIQNLKDNKTD